MIKKLLDARKTIKSKKPDFKRQDSHKLVRLGAAWRAAKGRHNKYRTYRNGAMPSPSYGSPAKVRGLHASGLKEVIVANPSDLDSIEKGTAARIRSSVGIRKRVEIIKKAQTQKIKVLNPGVSALRVAENGGKKKSVKDKKNETTSKKTEDKAKKPKASENKKK